MECAYNKVFGGKGNMRIKIDSAEGAIACNALMRDANRLTEKIRELQAITIQGHELSDKQFVSLCDMVAELWANSRLFIRINKQLPSSPTRDGGRAVAEHNVAIVRGLFDRLGIDPKVEFESYADLN